MYKAFKSYTFEIDDCDQLIDTKFIVFKAEDIIKKKSESQDKHFLKFYGEFLRDGVLYIESSQDSRTNKKCVGKIELSEPLDYKQTEKLISLILSTYIDEELSFWSINMSAPENYWDNIVAKLPDNDDIVSRLVIILKGFYLEQCTFSKKQPTLDGLIDFWDSKRPYGNKDIPSSILYTLGLDYGRVLCWDFKDIPKNIEELCDKWHEDVLIRIKSDI